MKPAAAQVTVLVRARTAIAVSRRLLRNGDTVRFSGRLLGGPVPDGGKLIDLQAHYRRQWRTFATPRTDAGGRWQQDYRFEATRGLVRYRFRARIRREAAYPYELGYSRVLSVTVRGPWPRSGLTAGSRAGYPRGSSWNGVRLLLEAPKPPRLTRWSKSAT